MTPFTRRRLGVISLWFSVGVNGAACLADLWRGDYGLAGLASALIALLLVGAWVFERMSVLFDAQIRQARAQCEVSERARDLMVQQMAQTAIVPHVRVEPFEPPDYKRRN